MENGKTLSLPVAIVAAALIIGGAIFFTNGTGSRPAEAAVFFDPVLEDLDIDRDDFLACMQDESTLAIVSEEFNEAAAVGGTGTPYTIIVGPNGNLYPVSGALPLDSQGAQTGFRDIVASIRDGSYLGQELTAEQAAKFSPVTEDDYVRGSKTPTVTLVEYSDFECPFCARAHSTFQTLVNENSDVAWVYRHFPLQQLHPQAIPAAVGAECIRTLTDGNDEAFWNYADHIFKNQSILQSAPYRG